MISTVLIPSLITLTKTFDLIITDFPQNGIFQENIQIILLKCITFTLISHHTDLISLYSHDVDRVNPYCDYIYTNIDLIIDFSQNTTFSIMYSGDLTAICHLYIQKFDGIFMCVRLGIPHSVYINTLTGIRFI